MRFPSQKRITAQLKAWDEAAYWWLVGLRLGRSAWFCGGYGLGLAAMAVGPGQGEALPWFGIALVLFLAGVAHDNERGSAVRALPEPRPRFEAGDREAAPELPPPSPRRCMPPELADAMLPVDGSARAALPGAAVRDGAAGDGSLRLDLRAQ